MFLETDDSGADIADILKRVAHLRGVSEEELGKAILENIRSVFFRL
jgi:Tat protein secretion system quality control protein TatD with DNase activity